MIPRVVLSAGVLCAVVARALVTPLLAQDSGSGSPKASAKTPMRPLPVAAYAGQTVPVLPITLVAAEAALKHDSLYATYRDRDSALARSDAAIGAALGERGPEVQWVLAPALRKLALRSPGLVKDPDELGQAILRSPRLKDVPEPLRAELRKLVAISGGRAVLVPASLGFSGAADANTVGTSTGKATATGVRADLTLVLVDVRAGKILWRSVVSGNGATPEAALDAALAAALPLESP